MRRAFFAAASCFFVGCGVLLGITNDAYVDPALSPTANEAGSAEAAADVGAQKDVVAPDSGADTGLDAADAEDAEDAAEEPDV